MSNIGIIKMTSSAHICFDSRQYDVDLQFVCDIIESGTNWIVCKTEWEGFGIVIPQLLVQTSVPFLIQIENDPDWVPEENKEFGEWAGLTKDSELFQALELCDARLAIQSTTSDQVTINEKSINVSTLGAAVDPSNPEISEVLAIIGNRINGLLNDCVNGGLKRA